MLSPPSTITSYLLEITAYLTCFMTRASAFNPPWETELSAVVGSIVVRVFDRKVGLPALGFCPVLGVDPQALQVPDHNLITLIAGYVQHIAAQLGMAVVGERDNDVPLSVHQAAMLRTGTEQHQVLS